MVCQGQYRSRSREILNQTLQLRNIAEINSRRIGIGRPPATKLLKSIYDLCRFMPNQVGGFVSYTNYQPLFIANSFHLRDRNGAHATDLGGGKPHFTHPFGSLRQTRRRLAEISDGKELNRELRLSHRA